MLLFLLDVLKEKELISHAFRGRIIVAISSANLNPMLLISVLLFDRDARLERSAGNPKN
jgi:hypothetical protein